MGCRRSWCIVPSTWRMTRATCKSAVRRLSSLILRSCACSVRAISLWRTRDERHSETGQQQHGRLSLQARAMCHTRRAWRRLARIFTPKVRWRGSSVPVKTSTGRMRLVRSLEGLQTASRKVISLSKHHESQTARTTSRDTSTAIRCDDAAIDRPPAPRHRTLAPPAHHERSSRLPHDHCASARTCDCRPPQNTSQSRRSHKPAT